MGSSGVNGEIMPHATLEGRVALITGAGRGLGAQIAKDLAAKGASIVVNFAKSAVPAQQVVAEIERCGGKALAVQADVSKPKDVAELFEQAVAYFGHLDVVMNNSGMESFTPTLEVTEEEYNAVFGLNTRAQFFVAQQALKHLSRGGRIIFMSSIAASMSVPNHALYCASKSAAEGLMRSFTADAGPRGVTCNAIAPGGIKTDMFDKNAWHYAPGATETTDIKIIEQGIAIMCPLRRVAEVADISRVVAFLASPESEWINGQVIKLTGGSASG